VRGGNLLCNFRIFFKKRIYKPLGESRFYIVNRERKADNKLIGSGGIYYKEDLEAFNMGYNIMKDCWHQGYTTEAARAMTEFAFLELKTKRIYANHAVDNPNSGKVMEKVGFRYFKDGFYDSMDGTKHFESKFYVLEAPEE